MKKRLIQSWFDIEFFIDVGGLATTFTVHSVGGFTAKQALGKAQRIAQTAGLDAKSARVYPLAGRDLRTAIQRMAAAAFADATDTIKVHVGDDTLTLNKPPQN